MILKIDYKYDEFQTFFTRKETSDDFDDINFIKTLSFDKFINFYTSLNFDDYVVCIINDKNKS